MAVPAPGLVPEMEARGDASKFALNSAFCFRTKAMVLREET